MSVFATASKSYTYDQFLELLDNLLTEGKTTGTNQSEEYLHYAKLNMQRMRRWNKTYEINADLAAKIRKQPAQEWWVITEGWCGDSAQNLPALVKMAAASSGKIKLRIVLRDENPDIMDQYLTNGTSRSIPILAAFNQEGQQLFKWGPRPEPAHALLLKWKSKTEPEPFEEFEKEMHTWYTQDKGRTLEAEIGALLEN